MNNFCKICNSKVFNKILDRKKTKIFTNSYDKKINNFKVKCVLYQCQKCNFIFQIPSKILKKKLTKIYQSKNAQLSQTLGEGNWGIERFNMLKSKLSEIYKFKNKNILELACGNGYVLHQLSKQGFKHLYGIDPSINNGTKKTKVKFIKDFVNHKLNLGKKFDFIFSIGLYEHSYDINELTNFSINHLSEKGQILIMMPNFYTSLKNGNPDLFAHEHINYFTLKSIKNHFKKFNFKVVKNFSDNHSIVLYLTKSSSKIKKFFKKDKIINYNYNSILNTNLKIIRSYMNSNNLLIHGACNSLNNIISWLNIKKKFVLVDNDENKISKFFFNNKVISINDVNLKKYKNILIIPSHFAKTIKHKYIKMGYRGTFYFS